MVAHSLIKALATSFVIRSAGVYGERITLYGLDFNLFGVYQFGSFSGKQISAFSAAIDAGYKLFNLPWAPRMAGSLQISSGSSSLHGSKLETFNAMFPAGYYYGAGTKDVDYVSIWMSYTF
jgi:hypothetical protein